MPTHLNCDSAATEAALRFETLVPALCEAFSSEASVPLRHVHDIATVGSSGRSLIMPAWSNAGFYGVKIINIFPDNVRYDLPGLHAVYALFDAVTGVPLAMLDGNVLTAWRTAAASALGARYLARPDASELLVVGSGRVARLIPAAMQSVRSIKRVNVWSRRRENAEALVRKLGEEGITAVSVADLETAVRSADIVSCATLSSAPLIYGEWLRPGAHLDLIGSFTPDMRETDSRCFTRASAFVDTDEAVMKAGDILHAIAEGGFSTADVRATLSDLCRGRHRGRLDPEEITLFKAVGSALEDLAAAIIVYQTHSASGNCLHPNK
jgi:ornithine cyclodeaminase/alanine dehydrogenase-like protein (mu-crystallin family)